jgi:hypothetical protein
MPVSFWNISQSSLFVPVLLISIIAVQPSIVSLYGLGKLLGM